MEKSLCIRPFIRYSRFLLIIISIVAIVNSSLTILVPYFLTGYITWKLAIPNLIGIFLVCVFMNGVVQSSMTMPKLVLLNVDRKSIFKSSVINDFFYCLIISLILLGLVTFITSNNTSIMNLLGIYINDFTFIEIMKFYPLILLGVIFINNISYYIVLMFYRFGILLGLSNLFVLIGVGVFFMYDLYVVFVNGNIITYILIALLGSLTLYFANYKLINSMEIRG